MSEHEKQNLLSLVPEWQIKNNRLSRQFALADFNAAITFVNAIATAAEKLQHHPDIYIHYNRVDVEIWTHDINDLSDIDFMLAKNIDTIER